MFDLKSPCKSCPFRSENGHFFMLTEERLQEIFEAPAFQCHRTVNYGEDEHGNETHAQGANPQQCAGLMAILHRDGCPNQIMQVAERFSRLDPAELDPKGLAYKSRAEALAAHTKRLVVYLPPFRKRAERA